MRIGRKLLASGMLVILAMPAAPEGLRVSSDLPRGLPQYFKESWYDAKLLGLGYYLFGRRELSKNFNISCASCHKPSHSFADDVQMSLGSNGETTQRNSPHIVNMYAGTSFMWDGKAKNLLSQITMPLESPKEMNIDWDRTISVLYSDNNVLEILDCLSKKVLTKDLIVQSIAVFVSSLVSGSSRVDRYLFDGDNSALTDSEKRGLEIFRGKANCTSCHKIESSYALYTDNAFHNLGLNDSNEDNGRMAVTGLTINKNQFKTPSLRNVSKTAPYMHNGQFAELTDVIDFYSDGPKEYAKGVDRKLKKLNLSEQEISDLVDFLSANDSEVLLYVEKASNNELHSDLCFAATQRNKGR